LGGIALAAAATVVTLACAGGPEAPTWTLVKPELDEDGNAAMLLPSNDTRVNLLLLLADRRGAIVHDPNAKAAAAPLALFSWFVMSERAVPPNENDWKDYDRYFGSRCQSNQVGAAAFVAAVRSNPMLPQRDRDKLIAARRLLSPEVKKIQDYLGYLDCGAKPLSDDDLQALSALGREFAAYLSGARDFYAGDFERATSEFQSLAGASDPWVRETASYMVGRTLLSHAVERSTTEYGSLEREAGKRDVQSALAAGSAFQNYLKAYPKGIYRNSTRGLMRRVYWLTGNDQALATEYGQQLESPAKLSDAAAAIGLVNEIDNKLPLPTMQPKIARDPVLLAVVDLQRMRQNDAYREYCCGPAIDRAEIDGQRGLFGDDTDLYDYIRAAEAFFVRHQPAEALQLLPDAAHQQRFTYLQFSRQMLRGLALEATGDRYARSFWLSLFPGAVQPYQREAVELELALHDEKAGRLDLVFAPNSPVTHPIMRAILLEEVAGPKLLRQQATRPETSKYERDAALYTLLTKQIRRGLYRDFINDSRFVSPDAPIDGNEFGAIFYAPRWTTSLESLQPPLGKYGPKAPLGDFGCPPLTTTLSQLVAAPRSIRGRLCLGEYFRANGFKWYPEGYGTGFFGALHKPGTLGATKELFPKGRSYSRLEDYKAIMNDQAANADEKALALNRAIRCYAPVGSNDCGGIEVSLAVRRGWFNRLHAQYPHSRWAKDLKYYW
jgi:hypothetical protein